MAYREIVREDLSEEKIQSFGFNAVFLVAKVRCDRCEGDFRIVTRPHHDETGALTEAIEEIRTSNWRAEVGGKPVCPQCQQREASP